MDDIERIADWLYYGNKTTLDHDGDVKYMTDITSHLVGQLVDGCGNVNCRNIACYTGRCNTSSAPVRKHTARSARIIALCTLFQPNAVEKRCQYYMPGAGPHVEDDSPYDMVSFVQRLADTAIIRRITTPSSYNGKSVEIGDAKQNLARDRLTRMADMCSKIQLPPYSQDGSLQPDFMSDQMAAHHILAILRYLGKFMSSTNLPVAAATVGSEDLETWLQGLDLSGDETTPSAFETRVCSSQHLQILQYSHDALAVKLLCRAFGYRLALGRVMTKARLVSTSAMLEQVRMSFREAFSAGRATSSSCRRDLSLCQLLKLALINDWTGTPLIRHGSITHGALQLLDVLYSCDPNCSAMIRLTMHDLYKRMDELESTQSWLDYEKTASPESIHILTYHNLITDDIAARYFTLVNHLRMRYARTTTSSVSALYHEFMDEQQRPLRPQVQRKLHELRSTFLLFRVRRDHILEDAFNQLCLHRPSALHKPLRIRIVELDGLAMGQDLGGVQIEFFNLVMQHVTNEDNGLFTTNESGISYLTPGSLQPLHMFELVGVILGLALYNGISVPINLPIALYNIIMKGKNDDPLQLEDRWKAEAASMRRILDSDISDWSLSYDFNLAANGLQITVPRSSLAQLSKSETDRTWYLPVGDVLATDSGSVPSRATIQGQEIDWPGWTFVTSHDEESSPVNNDNKKQFVNDYIQWITKWSVQPQLESFLNGFHRVVHPRTLELLHSPALLQGLLEGTSEVDIEALRLSCVYEDFNADDEYIRTFWKIVTSWSTDRQKALVRFVTAAERMPRSSAAKKLMIKIAKSDIGLQDPRLPTSSTCFGTLYLPVYSSEDLLAKNLATAVDLGEYGFGIG